MCIKVYYIPSGVTQVGLSIDILTLANDGLVDGHLCFTLPVAFTEGVYNMGIKLFVPGDSITATNYAGTTAIIGSNYNVDYSEG